mmetsp:Transcript_21682/g.42590  ORF Transcript_21682/g.42590 Transcript_21682/m.42590 type:complete len:279 (+) Transcript_21682:119-955(+)
MFKKRRSRKREREGEAFSATDGAGNDLANDKNINVEGSTEQGKGDSEDAVTLTTAKVSRRGMDSDCSAAPAQITSDASKLSENSSSTFKKPKSMSTLILEEEERESAAESAPKKPVSRFGPRTVGGGSIKTTVMVDYQADVCKDYKETGYCGFGDSCKFIHDRGDYKSGWELERDWQAQERRKTDKFRAGKLGSDPLDREDTPDNKPKKEDIPFACHICRQPFTKPVVTLCGHYFCRKCAFAHNAKSTKCAICSKPTKGIFNAADEIIAKAQQSSSAE